jgi:DNA modification methylase
MSKIQLIRGDCVQVLNRFPDNFFDAASFSPPYGVGSEGFDIRVDFKKGGKFMPFMEEICRVSKVVAINLTQRVVNRTLSDFTEEFTQDLKGSGITLFDRWVVVKPTAMPKRGERALTNFEFVLLYTKHDQTSIKRRECSKPDAKTVIQVRGHGSSPVSVLGTTPYFKEIPLQVFDLYGHNRVLDPFCGSGTSLFAAKELGISAVGVELNAEIYLATSVALGVS